MRAVEDAEYNGEIGKKFSALKVPTHPSNLS